MCKEKRTNIVCIAICVLIACAVFIYVGQNKRISFCDEIYSYTITNSDRATYQFDANTIYSRAEIVDMLSHGRGDSIVGTLKNVASDKVHPPLYYVFMYIASVIFGGHSKWIGLGVNMVFLLGTVVLMWLFMYDITKDRLLSLLALMVYLFNMSTLSDAMLIRMYMQMTFFVMAFLYCDNRLKDDGKKRRIYPWLTAVTVGGFLTQYYFAFFAMAFFVVEFFINRKNNMAKVKTYFFSMLTAVGVSTLIWPLWIPSMLFNSHAGSIAESAVDFRHFFVKIYEAFRTLQVSIFQKAYAVGMIFFVVLCAVFFLSKRVREHRTDIRNLVIKMVAALLAYSILVRILTPDYLTSPRYYYAAQMLELVSIIVMLYALITEYAVKHAVGVFACVCVLLTSGDVCGYALGYGIDYYGDAKVYDERMELLSEYSDALWVLTDYNSYKLDAMMDYLCIPEYIAVIDTGDTAEYNRLEEFNSVERTIIISLEHMVNYETVDFSDRGLYFLIAATGRFAKSELLFSEDGVRVYEAELQ